MTFVPRYARLGVGGRFIEFGIDDLLTRTPNLPKRFPDHLRLSENLPRPMRAVQLHMARAAGGWACGSSLKRPASLANTVTHVENGADAKQSTSDAYSAHLKRLASSSPMVIGPASDSPRPLQPLISFHPSAAMSFSNYRWLFEIGFVLPK